MSIALTSRLSDPINVLMIVEQGIMVILLMLIARFVLLVVVLATWIMPLLFVQIVKLSQELTTISMIENAILSVLLPLQPVMDSMLSSPI